MLISTVFGMPAQGVGGGKICCNEGYVYTIYMYTHQKLQRIILYTT